MLDNLLQSHHIVERVIGMVLLLIKIHWRKFLALAVVLVCGTLGGALTSHFHQGWFIGRC